MSAKRELEDILKRSLERAGPKLGDILIVAASGGPDSTALLYGLMFTATPLGIALHVAHVNHDFRGEEADGDAEFVRQLAARLELPSTVEDADSIAYQRQRRISSFEDAARQVRHRFLADVAERVGASAVALGHTANDQAETIALHLMRGAGLAGLSGMRELAPSPAEGRPNTLLFRPLLQAPRALTRAYCEEQAIPFRDDTTNSYMRFARNRVRRHLMPELQAYNPRIVDALARVGHIAAEAQGYLETSLDAEWPTLAQRGDGVVHLDTEKFGQLAKPLRAMALRRAYLLLAGGAKRLTERHVTAMSQMAIQPHGQRYSLPSGLVFVADADCLKIGVSSAQERRTAPSPYEVAVTAPGVTIGPDWTLEARLIADGSGAPKSAKGARVTVNVECLRQPLIMRTRKRGDRFRPLGAPGSRKLGRFFTDAKIPADKRDETPLLVSGDRVIWVIPHRISEYGRAPNDAGPAMSLHWRRRPPA